MSTMREGMWVGLCSHKASLDEGDGVLGLKTKVELTTCRGEKHSEERKEHVQRSWGGEEQDKREVILPFTVSINMSICFKHFLSISR